MAKVRKPLGTAADIEAAFYDAISQADIEAMMALWADDEEIICVHPGALRLIGHAAIRAAWEMIFRRGGIRIRPVQLHATQNLMMAVHNVIEEIEVVTADKQDLHILATNVYAKTPQGWRIVAHHASVAPGKPVTEQIGSATLH